MPAPGEKRLPEFIAPMLCKAGTLFDSDEFFFEVKWDGIRCLAFVDGGRCRLVNRHGREMTERYPELAGLCALEGGTVLDGELVLLRDGKPDFASLQQRDRLAEPRRIRAAARRRPVTYMVFDQLSDGYEPLMSLGFDVVKRVILIAPVAVPANTEANSILRSVGSTRVMVFIPS